MKLSKNWFVVERFSPRHLYDVPEDLEKEPIVEEIYQEEPTGDFTIIIDLDNPPLLSREDNEIPKVVPSSIVHAEKSKNSSNGTFEDFINDDDEVNEHESNNEEDEEEILSDNDIDSE